MPHSFPVFISVLFPLKFLINKYLFAINNSLIRFICKIQVFRRFGGKFTISENGLENELDSSKDREKHLLNDRNNKPHVAWWWLVIETDAVMLLCPEVIERWSNDVVRHCYGIGAFHCRQNWTNEMTQMVAMKRLARGKDRVRINFEVWG